MGINQSQPSKQNIIDHPLLGKVILGKSLQNTYYYPTIEIIKVLPNQNPVDRWISSLKNNIQGLCIIDDGQQYKQICFAEKSLHQQQQFSSLLLPIKYSWKIQGLCGQGGTLKVHFEAFMFTLKDEIQNRLIKGKYFLETEAWFLLLALVKVEKEFEKVERKLGNLHPQNVLINDDGQIKVFGKCSLVDGLDNFEQKSIDIRAKAFLAPQQIEGANNRNELYVGNVKQTKSQMFSLGLTILCAATLCLGEGFYTIDETTNLLQIHLVEIQEKLKSLEQHYSSFLYNVVKSMLKIKPEQRITAEQVYLSLRQYEPQILDLHPFLPKNQISFVDRIKTRQSIKNPVRKSDCEFGKRLTEYEEEKEFRLSQERRLKEFYSRFKY